MSETVSDVLRQVIVGVKFPARVASVKAAEQQFQTTLKDLTAYLADFKVALVSGFITKPYASVGYTATVVFSIGAGSVAELLARDKPYAVAYWERNSIARMCTLDDPLYARGQWGLQRIGALDGWSTTVNTPVTIAVIDSGVMWRWSTASNAVVDSHEDLGGAEGGVFPPRLWRSAEQPPMDGLDNDGNDYVDDFNGARIVGRPPTGKNGDGHIGDEVGHGTMLAGIMFATSNNGRGLASPLSGYWPNIKLMPVKFFDADTRPKPANAKQAIQYAVDNGAKVINASWHVGPGRNGVRPIEDAIAYAQAAGVLVVAAAGNDGSNNDRYPTYPASLSYDNVLAVHATNRRDGKPSFSNYGKTSVDLGAPGVSIATTVRYLSARPRYKAINGTSAAAAFASVAAAMVIAMEQQRSGRTLTPAEVIAHLLMTADPVAQLRQCSRSGKRLNLATAVNTPAAPARKHGYKDA